MHVWCVKGVAVSFEEYPKNNLHPLQNRHSESGRLWCVLKSMDHPCSLHMSQVLTSGKQPFCP